MRHSGIPARFGRCRCRAAREFDAPSDRWHRGIQSTANRPEKPRSLMDGTCVVFGGTGAIGGTIARQLVSASRDVEVVSRHAPVTTPAFVKHAVADVTLEDSVREVVQNISKTEPFAAVVYAVGLRPDVTVSLSHYETADWRRTFATYLDGFFYVYKASLPLM